MVEVYGLHHAKLNIEVPPRSMWQNLGYWTKTDSNDHLTTAQRFELACQTLLDELLIFSSLLISDGSLKLSTSTADDQLPCLKIIDLGIGCGDQSLRLHEHWASPSKHKLKSSTLIYVGITNNKTQSGFAQTRLKSLEKSASCSMQVFCADAAKPCSWPEDLTKLLHTDHESSEKNETWVMGLDSLYHFRPSRKAVFSWAYSQAKASIVASDLFLAEEVSLFQRLWLRFVCSLMGAPASNLMTIKAYRAQLAQAGYNDNNILVKDISENVFVPLADNLDTRHYELKRFGFGGLGAYKVGASIFRWFGTSGLVRCCVVVARR